MANVPHQGKSSTNISSTNMGENMGENRPGVSGSIQDAGAFSGEMGSSYAGGIASDSNTASPEKDLISRASEKLIDTAEQQKMAGADFVGSIAGAVRRAAGEFEGPVPQAAEYIRYAADKMDNMSDAVRRRDVGQIVSELQSFARQQPTAFLGATFLAGFAAVRFLKSSSSGVARSSAGMRAPRVASGMARYGDFGERFPASPIPPSDL